MIRESKRICYHSIDLLALWHQMVVTSINTYITDNQHIMNYTTFFFLMIVSTISIAQGSVGSVMGIDNGVFNEAIDDDKGDYQGTPYLYDDWHPIKVTTPNGDLLEAQKSKYDVHSHRIIVENDGKMIAANAHQVLSFSLELNALQKLEFIKVVIDDKIKYAELLKKGKITLQKIHDKKFKRGNSAEIASGGYNKTAVSKFSKASTSYYITIDGDEPKLLKRSSKGFAKAFPENQHKRIKSFIKSKKPDLKDDQSLVEFLGYLEEKLSF